MHKKHFLLLLIGILSTAQSFACANYYYSLNKEGELVPLGYNWKYPFNKNFNLASNVKKLKKLEAKLKIEKNYMLLSDYSVCLMKLGKPKEALEILQELYSHYPDEYKIAANLGTAYELNGQVDSALKYIKRDIQLNPNDHEGSEWVHVKILETKLELNKNAKYLTNNTVLKLTEAQKNDTSVLQHISIQLQERVPFTPATSQPNDIMASLFIDLADISANIKSVEYARAYYQIAKKYYGSELPLLDEKIKEMEKLISKYTSVKPKYDKDFEGAQTKVGYIKYQELLNDNNASDYKVNWEKINTDVPSLLAMVDFTKTTSQVKSATNRSSTQAGELKLVPEDHHGKTQNDSAVKVESLVTNPEMKDVPKQTEINHMWLFLIGVIVAIGLIYFIVRRVKL